MSKQRHLNTYQNSENRSPTSAELAQAQQRIRELESQLANADTREQAAQQHIARLEDELAEAYHTDRLTEARMNTLLTVSAALLVTHEIDLVLDLVVRESTELFPGTHGALLFLHDPELQQLMLHIANRDRIIEVNLPGQRQIKANALLTPRAMLIQGDELQAMLAELHVERHITLETILAPWPPSSALLAPLRDDTRHMGALVIYRSTADTAYRAQDMPFIQALADLAAVAITETYQRARAAALQRDLAQTQFLHREAQARLDTAQAQLLQSAKLAAVGELAASVAHEINNPLYAARNSLYLVAQDLPADTAQRQFLEIAQGELGRIARIITRMRDFYRPSRAELTLTHVNDLISDTIEFVQTHLRHSQVRALSDLDGNLPPIMAHIDQLRQVFLNLVLNACDAMPNGGTVSISTQTLHATAKQLAAIIVRVADTGTGIPPEHLEHIFEPFYTTKPQGTGLGLAISAHIVTQHAGQITVESTVGRGTTFMITMPIITESDQDDEDPACDARGKPDQPPDTR